MTRHGSPSFSRAACTLPAMMTLMRSTPAASAVSRPPHGKARYQPMRAHPMVSTAPTGRLPRAALPRGPAAENRKTHRSASRARGFLLWRISYTCRCPISFTDVDVQTFLDHCQKRTFVHLTTSASCSPQASTQTNPLRVDGGRDHANEKGRDCALCRLTGSERERLNSRHSVTAPVKSAPPA
jgi:hypothetical protein